MTDNIYVIESGYVPPPRTNYCGEYIDNGQRNGEGCHTWNKSDYQEYTGNFVQDNLHGHGKYVKLDGSNSYMYEGTLYANDFEGYSNIIYLNGDYFEGLFKHNKRFGPGVYTYADGSQNVGLWYGTQLIRLSTVVMSEWVPKLAIDSVAKAKLLKYRKLVPIRQEYENIAKNILTTLNVRPELLAMSNKLYNPYIRNMNSLFFDKRLYDVEFFGEFDCTIDVLDERSGLLPTPTRSSLIPIKSTKEIASSREIVREILDYLIENVHIVEDFPISERKSFVYESIIKARKEFQLECDTNIINEMLDEFMQQLDYILSKPNLERTLILKKNIIQKILPEDHKTEIDINLKKIAVTDLLAWNNEKMSIDILKHVFAHRNRENSVSFSIGKLLSGNREKFNTTGELERNCALFLSCCSSGNENEVIKIFQESGLNPDLCDARGNSGIIFASARDMWRVITILCDLGANLDFINDEGLTALSICILRYIALQNDIRDWQRAFIADAVITYAEELQVKQWHPHVSLTNINMLSSISSEKLYTMPQEADDTIGAYNKVGSTLKAMTDDTTGLSNTAVYEELRKIEIGLVFKKFQEPYSQSLDLKQSYIFNVKCLPQSKTLSIKSKKTRQRNNNQADRWSKRSDSSYLRGKTKKKEDESINFIKQNKLKVIFKTIRVLLGCGADPNVSQVPLPAILLAIFCNNMDLVHLLLQSNANPDIISQEEGLSALHILAALPFTSQNLEMFRLLLNNRANPNIRTNIYHWMQEKEKILGKHELVEEDLGKTPMHILSMRYDFANNDYIQTEMVNSLIENGGNLQDMYLGHNPFTLAILRGNLHLIKFYLNSGQVNPYSKLGENMGVATTILILKRYANVLPLDKCKSVYNLFLEMNVNPLVEIDGNGNAIEFMETEYNTQKDDSDNNKSQVGGSKKESTNGSRTIPSKFSKRIKPTKRKEKFLTIEETKKCLVECTKRMLQKHIQYQAFKYLTRFIMQSVDSEDDTFVALIKFLPPKDLVNLLQLLIHRGKIHPKPNYFYVASVMLELSKKYDRVKDKKSKNSDITSLPPSTIIKKLDWTEQKVVTYFNMIEPEIDAEVDKYKVCFYCYKKIGKDLIVCPVCGLVYFCCQECNRLSNKESTVHKCNVLFYDEQKQLRDYALQNNLEYVKSKLEEKLQYLNDIFREKYGAILPCIGASGDIGASEFDFDKLDSVLYDKMLENDPDLLEKMRAVLEKNDLTDFEETIKLQKELTAKSKDKEDNRSQVDSIANISKESEQRKFKRKKKDIGDGSTTRAKGVKRGDSIEHKRRRKEKITNKYGKKGSKNSKSLSDKSSKRKAQRSSRSSEKSSRKHRSIRSKSGDSHGRGKPETFRKGKSKGMYSKGDKSSKYAVYKQVVLKSDHTKSMKDKYDVEQKNFREKYEDKAGLQSLLHSGKFGTTMFDKTGKNVLEHFGKLPHKCQFFIERLSELFPDIDLSQLFWPYVCYVDGQLYYRFLEERPVFLETYSNI